MIATDAPGDVERLRAAGNGDLDWSDEMAANKQGVRHVGTFPDVEDECRAWVKGTASSPDRLDALVWGSTELLLMAGRCRVPIVLRGERPSAVPRERAGVT
ncbi:MAG TPA: hypothetical protein VMB51_01535 [Solirubrobacteraceae bacterium]|nr:hypothetical protein [Solirubrobacteraceae bacterium]